MALERHPERWLSSWMSEDEKKKYNQFLFGNGFNESLAYIFGVLEDLPHQDKIYFKNLIIWMRKIICGNLI